MGAGTAHARTHLSRGYQPLSCAARSATGTARVPRLPGDGTAVNLLLGGFSLSTITVARSAHAAVILFLPLVPHLPASFSTETIGIAVFGPSLYELQRTEGRPCRGRSP